MALYLLDADIEGEPAKIAERSIEQHKAAEFTAELRFIPRISFAFYVNAERIFQLDQLRESKKRNPMRTYLAIFIMLFSSVAAGQNFTQFRGEGGRGVSEATIPSEISVEKNLDWTTKIEGGGWSQPVLWDGKIYLTSAIAANGFVPKNFAGGVRMPQSMGGGSKAPDYEVEWKVICLDEKTGESLWHESVKTQKPKFGIHPSNSYATETPAVDSEGVYAYFGAIGAVVAFSHDGKLKWQKEVGTFKTGNDFGTGSSIAIHDGKIFVQSLSEESSDIWCFNNSNGDVVWKKARDAAGTSWSTPVIWKNDQRVELVVSGGMQIQSFDPSTGADNWIVSKVKSATACSVCVDDKHIYFGGSDPMSKGPLFAVSPGGTGTIEPKRTNQTFESCSWRVPRSGPGMASPVSNGQYLYIVDRNILRCHEASTGKEVYKERMPGLSMVVACPLVVGDKVVLVDEDGKIGMTTVGPEFKFQKIGDLEDTVWSSPGVSKDALYVRGVKGLYRIGFHQKKPDESID